MKKKLEETTSWIFILPLWIEKVIKEIDQEYKKTTGRGLSEEIQSKRFIKRFFLKRKIRKVIFERLRAEANLREAQMSKKERRIYQKITKELENKVEKKVEKWLRKLIKAKLNDFIKKQTFSF